MFCCTFIYIKKSGELSHLHKYSDHLLSTLLKHIWQRLQPQVYLDIMLQAWHTCIWGSSFHSSLHILSSSVRLYGERRCTAIFRSLQRCSIGFKSGLWLDHSRTFIDLSQSHSCVVLAVCLGLLSCLKVNLHTGLEQVFIKDLFVLCSIHLSLDPD